MKYETKCIIFTDLDGTLLDKNYNYKKAKLALKLIKKKKVPLVFCTSKTRAEIEEYRKRLHNSDPFIVENGGAIFIPKQVINKNLIKKTSFSFKSKKGYYVIELGAPYSKLIRVFKKIKKKFNVKGFSDMSVKTIAKDAKLPLNEAKLAKKREYEEPFKILDKNKKKIIDMIKINKLRFIEGTRYYHLTSKNDKGKAVRILIKLYKEKYKNKIKSIALGDSYNDYPMLNVVNKPFLIQRFDSSWAKKASRKFIKVRGIASIGWNKAILGELKK